MATAAQVLATRENAHHSTGPRTEEGKANSSLNNLSHGPAARGFIVLPGQESAFEDLEAGLRACLTARFKNRSSQASSKPPGTSTAAASPRPYSTRIPSTPPSIPYSTTSKPPSTPAFKNTPAKTKAPGARPSTNSAAFRRKTIPPRSLSPHGRTTKRTVHAVSEVCGIRKITASLIHTGPQKSSNRKADPIMDMLKILTAPPPLHRRGDFQFEANPLNAQAEAA